MLSKTPQVEREQKKRREVKNEAVMRLAGEIRDREQVIFKSNFHSVQMFEQVALEKEEILLELHEGRKAEEEAFKEQREMEQNIKRRLLLRLMQFFKKITNLLSVQGGK